jgi:excisionase family DNA binding protein
MSIDPEFPYSPRLLEVGHVAQTLRLSPEQVRRLIRSHQLPAFRLGHRWRVYHTALEAFLAAQQVERRQPEAPADRRQPRAEEAQG